MGEYARRKSDSEQIKIGTCELMYYLRWDDIDKVEAPYDLREPGLSFRLPLPAEDGIQPGSYSSYDPGIRLLPYEDDGHIVCFDGDDTIDHPGFIQLHHPSGLLIRATCFHGLKLPEDSDELQACWNGKDPHVWELIRIKNHPGEGLLPIVQCRHCKDSFRSSWAAVLPHVHDQALRDRLTDYAAFHSFTPTPS